ncbi:MAG: four helix bundle protein [Melioribacteraceae bacterium]|nr:four helix bundle protein [Melioribacteraceae bacterium]MCF8264842.1 four helix bundle protein [Melioribacteraceae bacterium]
MFKYLPNLPITPEFKIIRYQLAKCSSSSGANYEESQAGSSRADFNNKVRISLREMRESNYWLRIIKATLTKAKINEELEYLINESAELKKILGSIVTKTRTANK